MYILTLMYDTVVLFYAIQFAFFSELWFLQIEILIIWKVEHYWINSLQKFRFSRRMVDIFLDKTLNVSTVYTYFVLYLTATTKTWNYIF